ncbi:MAG: dynein arm light chain [Candidatus Pacebacteria bacterium]|nr:dynein arm light chain [Candidatus Paceibacterota bacterium]
MLGVHYIQYVSHKPAEREDMMTLTRELDRKLTERQARDNGICPVREELYSQCFDELIRQVTINSPERGALLYRVREDIRMTVSSYQTLYQRYVVAPIIRIARWCSE